MVTDCRGVLKSVNQTVSDPRDVSKSLKAEPRSCQCAPSEVKRRGKHRPFTLHQHQDWGTQYLIISVIQWHPLPAVMSRLCGDDSRVWSLSLSLSSSFIFTRHFLSVLLSTNKCNTLNVVLETSPKDVHFNLHTYYTVKSPSCLMAGCSLHLHVAVWGGSLTNQRVVDG